MADVEEVEEAHNLDISKLKVAELKKELKTRGLSAVGNKNELMERLNLSLQGEGSLMMDSDLVVADSEEILDEDDVLADDDDIADISGKTDDIISDLTGLDTKRKIDELDESEDKALQPSKKIVLNRNVVTVSEKENQQELVTSDEASDSQEKKVIKLSTLGVKERLEMRAKKFGVSLSVDAKKEARAERFGMPSSPTSIGSVSTSVDVLKKRAERFGTSVSSIMNKVEQDEKLKKRQERFGVIQSKSNKKFSTTNISTSNSTLDDKKRQRAERFKLVK